MDNKIYDTPEYKRSRKAYMLECTFEYLVMLLVGDAFLATLLTHIGVSDALIGMISSFVSFAFLFQFLSIFIVKKLTNVKLASIVLNCLSLVLFMCAYIVPFLPFAREVKIVTVTACILLAYVSNYIINGVLFKWANSFVSPNTRASYSATKESISLISGIVFSLVIGYIIDAYAAVDNVEGGFIFITVSMLVLNICNFISLLLIKKRSAAMDIEEAQKTENITFREVMRNTLGNKNFISVVIMTSLWYAARYMTTGFLGTYKVKDLLIGVGLVQVINIAGNLCRIFISKPFGKYSDKHSFAKGMRWAFILEAFGYLFVIFTTPNTWWLMIPYTVFYSVSFAGLNQNSYNIVYSYVDSKYIVQAMAIKNSIAGVIGFLISLVAGRILSFIQGNGNTLFGIKIYGQQLLAVFSVLILIVTIIYVYTVIEKQSVKKQ